MTTPEASAPPLASTDGSHAAARSVRDRLHDRRVVGFALLCVAAAVSRALSWRWLRRFEEPPWVGPPPMRVPFRKFLRDVGRSNFTRFSLCLAAANFGASFSAPFFTVYRLEELRFGYLTYTTVMLAGAVTGFLSSPWWGRLGDRIGNQAVMRWAIVAVSVLPALGTLSGHPLAFPRFVREVREVRNVGLREVMLDMAMQGVVQVLGLFSVRPEAGGPRPRWRPPRRRKMAA